MGEGGVGGVEGMVVGPGNCGPCVPGDSESVVASAEPVPVVTGCRTSGSSGTVTGDSAGAPDSSSPRRRRTSCHSPRDPVHNSPGPTTYTGVRSGTDNTWSQRGRNFTKSVPGRFTPNQE